MKTPDKHVDTAHFTRQFVTRNWQKLLLFAFGIVFISLILLIVILIPTPTDFQVFAFRLVLALCAGAIGGLMPGFLELEGRLRGFKVRALGAFAAFAIVWFINPPRLISTSFGEAIATGYFFNFVKPLAESIGTDCEVACNGTNHKVSKGRLVLNIVFPKRAAMASRSQLKRLTGDKLLEIAIKADPRSFTLFIQPGTSQSFDGTNNIALIDIPTALASTSEYCKYVLGSAVADLESPQWVTVESTEMLRFQRRLERLINSVPETQGRVQIKQWYFEN
jgi:hypothetical protein